VSGDDKKQSVGRQLFAASAVGIHIAISVFVGFAIGYGLDELFGVGYLKFIFLFVGFVAGFAELFRVARKQEEKDNAGTSAGDDSKNN
jgi:F0F1-type ATP synthase assembly protein I